MNEVDYRIRTTSVLPPEIERGLGNSARRKGDREVHLRLRPSDVAGLRRNLLETARAESLDLLFAPATALAEPPKWVFFDGDSTLLAGETIDELARVAGVYDEVADITKRAMAGELDFQAALRERVALLKGAPATVLDDVTQAMHLSPGAEPAVRALQALDIRVGVLSGGFHFLLDRLEDRLGLDYVAGNRLEKENGKLTGQVAGTIVDAQRKARLLHRVLHDAGLSPAQAVAVGDGANDIPMLEAVGLGLGYRAKPALLEVVDGVLYGGGLDATLDLLGLR